MQKQTSNQKDFVDKELDTLKKAFRRKIGYTKEQVF